MSVDAEGQAPEETTGAEETAVTTNDAITQSTDEINDPAVLREMLSKTRHEAATHRKEKQSLRAELKEFHAWKDSQKTEAEKQQEAVTSLQTELTALRAEKIALEFNVPEELREFLTGTEEDMRTKAAKLGKPKDAEGEKPTEEYRPVNTFAGKRGGSLRETTGPQTVGGKFLSKMLKDPN